MPGPRELTLANNLRAGEDGDRRDLPHIAHHMQVPGQTLAQHIPHSNPESLLASAQEPSDHVSGPWALQAITGLQCPARIMLPWCLLCHCLILLASALQGNSIAVNLTFVGDGAGDRLLESSTENFAATPEMPDALALLSAHSSARGSLSVTTADFAPVQRYFDC